MRKLLLAAAVCVSTAFLAPSTQARVLTTEPCQDTAVMIPTRVSASTLSAHDLIVPVRYMHHRRHRHHR